MILLEKSAAAAPLSLTVVLDGAGITGLLPTVALRDAETTSSYLDFADGIFKTAGWTLKTAPMTEIGGGLYQRSLNVAAIASLLAGMLLAAEYHFDDGAGLVGDDHDLVAIVRVQQDAALLRKHLTNRIVEVSGNPGTLTLKDDDDVSDLLAWSLNDEGGGPVLPAVGTPARRAKATGSY